MVNISKIVIVEYVEKYRKKTSTRLGSLNGIEPVNLLNAEVARNMVEIVHHKNYNECKDCKYNSNTACQCVVFAGDIQYRNMFEYK